MNSGDLERASMIIDITSITTLSDGNVMYDGAIVKNRYGNTKMIHGVVRMDPAFEALLLLAGKSVEEEIIEDVRHHYGDDRTIVRRRQYV